mgnify:CR=1 FL=1
MILTEEKTYIINVTEVDTDAELGLNKKDIMIKYTNLELLHAVLASTMPYGRLSARYRGKRKAELQSRIAMVESVLETRGDQLVKAEQIMYLDTAERSAICHYLGIIYTRLIAQKLYGIDCMVPLNLIEQPGEKKFVKYNGAYRQDLIGYGKQNAWSVWEPVGRSENSQAAFGNGCRAASEIEKINENPLAKSAACMTYYERGYLNAVVKEPERTGDGTLWFPEENYFKAYYQPLFELFADEQPGELYGSSGGFELELTLPWTEEGKRGFRHLQIGTDPVTIALMREGKYDQILKRMENVLDLSKECRFCGEDGIWVGAEVKVIGSAEAVGDDGTQILCGKSEKERTRAMAKEMETLKDEGLQGNETIEEAILDCKRSRAPELLAHVLTVIRRRMKEGGQAILSVEPPSGDDQIRIGTVKSADGKVWWAAFTSFDEELKGSSSVKSTFLVSLEQLIHMASETKEISGVIFNPWNRTIMLDHTLLSIIIGEENAGH